MPMWIRGRFKEMLSTDLQHGLHNPMPGWNQPRISWVGSSYLPCRSLQCFLWTLHVTGSWTVRCPVAWQDTIQGTVLPCLGRRSSSHRVGRNAAADVVLG